MPVLFELLSSLPVSSPLPESPPDVLYIHLLSWASYPSGHWVKHCLLLSIINSSDVQTIEALHYLVYDIKDHTLSPHVYKHNLLFEKEVNW